MSYPILEITSWSDFKTTCLVGGKELLIQYVESSDAYEIYAMDSLIWHIRLPRPSADATDFETNYKATANARSNMSVVLVDLQGHPTTAELGVTAPASAALVAFKDDLGNIEAPTVFDLDTGAAKQPTQGVSVRLSASGGSIEAKGQKTMAASLPVAIASDQSRLPTVLYDAAGNAVTVTNDAGVRRIEINGKVTVVGASPPPATTPFAVFADTPLTVGSHDTSEVIPNGQTLYLQQLLAGNEDPTKGASVELIYYNGTEHLVSRMFMAGFSIERGFADVSTARDGTVMVGNGVHTLIVRRAKFSGSNIAIDAVVRGYTV
jgi:hypothetical protein